MKKSFVKALFIDDDESFLYICSKFFVKSNNKIIMVTLSDTYGIVRKIKALNPDIIFCDYKMPNITGVDIINILNTNGFNIPFVLVTSEKK